MDPATDRTRLVEQARRSLESAGRPRLVMLAVLAVTLSAGFLASMAMVHLGVNSMTVRYPIAVGVAYAAFLAALRVWLERQSADPRYWSGAEGLAAAGVAAAVMSDAEPSDESTTRKARQNSNWFQGGSGGGDLSNLGDSGGGLVALILLVLIAGICTLVVSVYLVATSPMLLAELLADGVLLGAMSRAITPDPSPHWSMAVIRRTWVAAMITAVVFGLVGYGIGRVAPGSRTLGEAFAAEIGSP